MADHFNAAGSGAPGECADEHAKKRTQERDARRIGGLAPAAAEAFGFLTPKQQALIHRRGWLKMLAPRAAGGAELALPAVVRLEEEIAAIDGSMAWVVTLCAGAGWFAGFLAPPVARAIIGTRRVCVAGSGAPTGYADRDGAGFRLQGRWDYASGAPMATHFTLNALVREHGRVVLDETGAARVRAFIIPAKNVVIESSWDSIGLRGSASHSYRIDDAWLGAEYGFAIDPAQATSRAALYRFPFMSLAFVTLSVNLAGMARHFLCLAESAIARRRHPSSGLQVIDMPGVAALLRRASDDLDSARGHFYRCLDAAWAGLLAGADIDAGGAALLRAASLELSRVARLAVDEIYPYCGLYAAHTQSEINRVWRDFHTATQHTLLLP